MLNSGHRTQIAVDGFEIRVIQVLVSQDWHDSVQVLAVDHASAKHQKKEVFRVGPDASIVGCNVGARDVAPRAAEWLTSC